MRLVLKCVETETFFKTRGYQLSFSPAKPSNQILRSSCYLPGKIHFFNSFENQIVGHHLVNPRKGWARENPKQDTLITGSEITFGMNFLSSFFPSLPSFISSPLSVVLQQIWIYLRKPSHSFNITYHMRDTHTHARTLTHM